jgi:hypothetical protein
MPSLADALAKQQPRHGGLICTVCELLAELKQEDADALTQALQNHRMPATLITRALEEYGKGISVGTLRRHRRQECATFRT